MRVDVVTLFPELFERFAELGVVGRAIADGIVNLQLYNPRDFGISKHNNVDDTPYGGGAGMVMRVDCVVECLESFERGHRVLLTPQGAVLNQQRVQALAAMEAVTLICGRYEGIDARVRDYIDVELSLGDFVLSGGELAAMTVIDAVARYLPGVLGNPGSLDDESHSRATGGLLEYPHYTRPQEFRGARVPDVLLSGNHANIDAWRREQALVRTRATRPDLAQQAVDGDRDSGADAEVVVVAARSTDDRRDP